MYSVFLLNKEKSCASMFIYVFIHPYSSSSLGSKTLSSIL